MKISVVGAGIGGLSLAWSLSERGHDITVFEQGAIPNPTGSSLDDHRVCRHAYGTMASYARLMPAAYQRWDKLWQTIGRKHYEDIGAIYIIREANDWYEASTSSLDELGIAYRDLVPAEFRERFPMVSPHDVSRVVETAGSGMLLSGRIMSELSVLVAASGVKLAPYTTVREVDPDRGRLRLDSGWVESDVVIVAAGAWLLRLLPEMEQLVHPSRQSVMYLAPPKQFAAAWSEAPVIVDTSEGSKTYALPPRFGMRLKIGDHIFTHRGDPEEDRLATDADLARLRQAIGAGYLFAESYAELERKSCFYTVEQQERFVVGTTGRRGYVLSACSGHGFKLQPLIAEGLAEAICGERSIEDVRRWAAGGDVL